MNRTEKLKLWAYAATYLIAGAILIIIGLDLNHGASFYSKIIYTLGAVLAVKGASHAIDHFLFMHEIKSELCRLATLKNNELSDSIIKDFSEKSERIINQNELLKKDLVELISKTVDDSRSVQSRKFRELGVVDIKKELDWNEINQQIKSAKKIQILKMWLHEPENISRSLEIALKAGAKVDIVLLSPNDQSKAIEKRTEILYRQHGKEELKKEKKRILGNIESSRVSLHNLYKRIGSIYQENLKLYYHSSFVSISLIRLDDKILYGTYLADLLSEQSLQIVLNRVENADTFNLFENHINAILNEKFSNQIKLLTAPDYNKTNKSKFVSQDNRNKASLGQVDIQDDVDPSNFKTPIRNKQFISKQSPE